VSKVKIFLALAAGFLVFYLGSSFLPSKKPVEILPTPTPVITSVENMRVTVPQPGQMLEDRLKIKGEARVFESSFAYRLTDDSGKILAEGHGMTNAPDIGQYGPFEVDVTYSTPSTGKGIVEVFEYSARDGSEINKVTIPVIFPQDF
jgi:hypothetical protein